MQRQRANHHIALIGCMCLALLAYTGWTEQQEAPAPDAPAAQAPADRIDFTSPESLTVIVNKHHPLDAAYIPPDLTDAGGVLLRLAAADSFRAMVSAAAAEGIAITAVSGYRPASEQAHIHDSYTSAYGAPAADLLSARPGYSEHQTGLAVDIGNPSGECALNACFASTPAGAWTAANAHRFGFIIRYPAGTEAVTGYMYEPWHLRYTGLEAAAAIHGSGTTLEQYAGTPAAPGY